MLSINDGVNRHREMLGLGVAFLKWEGWLEPVDAMEVYIRVVEEDGSLDMTDPDCRWANDFHALVAEALGLEDYSELEFISALETALDFKLGIDAIFRFRGHVCSIDVTTNTQKLNCGHKADFIIGSYWEIQELMARATEIANALTA